MLHIQQEDIEVANRAELWREELIEEIEQKVGGFERTGGGDWQGRTACQVKTIES
jgi:hypothetical protein